MKNIKKIMEVVFKTKTCMDGGPNKPNSCMAGEESEIEFVREGDRIKIIFLGGSIYLVTCTYPGKNLLPKVWEKIPPSLNCSELI